MFLPQIEDYTLVATMVGEGKDARFTQKYDQDYFVRHWENHEHNEEQE